MSNIDPADYAELKTQVAALRDQVGHLLRYIRFAYSGDDAEVIDGLTIDARVVSSEVFIVRDDKHRQRGRFCAWDNQASLALFDENEKGRLVLTADAEGGQIELRNPAGEATAQIFTDEGGHGNMAVFSPGAIPRVLIKGMDDGGSVATLAPDGKPRGVFVGSEDKSEIAFLGSKGKVSARLGDHADSSHLLLSNPDGRVISSLHATETGGSLLLRSATDQPGLQLIASDTGNMINVEGLEEGDDARHQSGISLTCVPGSTSLTINDQAGKTVADLIAVPAGAHLSLACSDSEASILLNPTTDSPIIRVGHPNGGSAALLSDATGGTVGLQNNAGTGKALLAAGRAGGHLALYIDDKLRLSAGPSDEGQSHLTLHNDEGSTAAQLGRHAHGGSVIVCNEEGTRQVAMVAAQEGGQLGLFGDLGIERALLRTLDDGAALSLRWGGTHALTALATEDGGAIALYDHEGQIRATLPGSPDLDSDPGEGES